MRIDHVTQRILCHNSDSPGIFELKDVDSDTKTVTPLARYYRRLKESEISHDTRQMVDPETMTCFAVGACTALGLLLPPPN